MKEIKLSERQAMILWVTFSWFQESFVRNGLMSKLYSLTGKAFRYEHNKEYEKIILKRIVEVADWIKNKHPELLN